MDDCRPWRESARGQSGTHFTHTPGTPRPAAERPHTGRFPGSPGSSPPARLPGLPCGSGQWHVGQGAIGHSCGGSSGFPSDDGSEFPLSPLARAPVASRGPIAWILDQGKRVWALASCLRFAAGSQKRVRAKTLRWVRLRQSRSPDLPSSMGRYAKACGATPLRLRAFARTPFKRSIAISKVNRLAGPCVVTGRA